MITIIFGVPRVGKTCFLSYLMNCFAFDKDRNYAMRNEILSKNANGFNLTVPQTVVSSNYDLNFRHFGYSERRNNRINPFRLGFFNPFVKTHFTIPYGVYAIDEAQEYLNSRNFSKFPSWQSRWYEQHGHNGLDIYLATHRPMLIDSNIRDLARLIEIVSLKVYNNSLGVPVKLKWTIREIENSSLFEIYKNSGKKDKSCYKEKTVVANFNVFDIYDSHGCKPRFYDGHFDEDFDLNYSFTPAETKEDYIACLKQFSNELPENFYKKGV